jgi:hypothetical protein
VLQSRTGGQIAYIPLFSFFTKQFLAFILARIRKSALDKGILYFEFSIIIANFGTNFADKQRSLGQYSSLADSGHGKFIEWPYPMRTMFPSIFPV